MHWMEELALELGLEVTQGQEWEQNGGRCSIVHLGVPGYDYSFTLMQTPNQVSLFPRFTDDVYSTLNGNLEGGGLRLVSFAAHYLREGLL